jgi:predicted anti-sigma-YlaC factor YlaD
MRCDEAQELITARVDNELGVDERTAIEAHLTSCAECALVFEQESILKRRIHLTAQQVRVPATLRRMIEEKTAVNAAVAGESIRRRFFDGMAFATWRRGFAAAVLLLIAGSVIYTQWPVEKHESVALAALETHISILSGKTTLLRAVNLAAMRKELAHAVGDRFKPVALDLSLMKLYPVSGFVQNIGGRDLLVTVYQGDGPPVTCFTFLGSETDAPQGAERFYDADLRINYYTFSRGDLNGVLHQEGDIICLLVSKISPADLLALLRGKSAHA